MVRDALDRAAQAGELLYVVVGLLVLGERAFLLDLVVPGEVGLVLGSTAVRRADGSLVLVISVATCGAVAGDSVSYWLGRTYGEDVATRWRFTRRHLAPGLARARAYFDRRGGPAVFGARFVGALRAVVPLVAGAARMPYGRFLVWATPAALLWATAVASAGWYLGDDVAATIDRLGWWVSIVVVAVVVIVWLVRRRCTSHASAPSSA